VKEVDFLPDWYRESKRRRSHLRRQYAALVLIFTCMMAYNLAVTHRTARATATLARFEDDRIAAESVLHQFNIITKELEQVRSKADLVEQIDAKIDVAAMLAELSHVIDERVVLSHMEVTTEAVRPSSGGGATKASGLRAAEGGQSAASSPVLAEARFKILLAGLASSPADVASLVCRLDDSAYFRDVHASFWRDTTVDVPVAPRSVGRVSSAGADSTSKAVTIEASEFEIVCYLANYEEIDDR
jgi:Tfp pilus assembly protein PilN